MPGLYSITPQCQEGRWFLERRPGGGGVAILLQNTRLSAVRILSAKNCPGDFRLPPTRAGKPRRRPHDGLKAHADGLPCSAPPSEKSPIRQSKFYERRSVRAAPRRHLTRRLVPPSAVARAGSTAAPASTARLCSRALSEQGLARPRRRHSPTSESCAVPARAAASSYDRRPAVSLTIESSITRRPTTPAPLHTIDGFRCYECGDYVPPFHHPCSMLRYQVVICRECQLWVRRALLHRTG